MKFDFDDILLTDNSFSSCETRADINILKDGYLPLMTAPMDTVISNDNIDVFKKNKIISVLPRGENKTEYSTDKVVFFSYGLKEFKTLFLEKDFRETIPTEKVYALVDIANGHMNLLYQMAKEAKEKYGNQLVLMVGNVASPEIYFQYAKIKVDYIRCGIGGGAGCLTTVQTGFGYPMASLISECNSLRDGHFSEYGYIVADGGFRSYSDIIKALALGADYVMCGSIFNKALESCSQTFCKTSIGNVPFILENVENANMVEELISNKKLVKPYRGMSTKEVQRKWGKETLRTSEGISKENIVEYKLEDWVENFSDYLKTAMSYCGKMDIVFFKNISFVLITENSLKRFKK